LVAGAAVGAVVACAACVGAGFGASVGFGAGVGVGAAHATNAINAIKVSTNNIFDFMWFFSSSRECRVVI
jgi:hypothetical protein